jgi:citrate lyase subunit beta / citryl-CoA lyase
MRATLQRSMMILPAHVSRFVEKAYLRGADAIVLDLEDAVPAAEKEQARRLVKEAIGLAGRGGADVLVRVNSELPLLMPDLEASMHPGLHGVFVPKVESAQDVTRVSDKLAELEREIGFEPGSILISVHIESPAGLLRVQEIAAASDRIESMSLGIDDYRFELGVEPSEEGTEIFLPLAMMVTVCKARGILPLGVLGSVARVRDLDGFERAAERGRQLGCEGAFCVHPDQVKVLNRVFAPSPRDVEHAHRVVAAFEEGGKVGRAAVNLDGGMVDTPIYKRAKLVLARTGAVAELESRKAAALRRWSLENDAQGT